MCGIWGLITADDTSKIDYGKIMSKLMSIKRRGPDRTIYIDNNEYKIGFHRLAIMDTSIQGDQPFSQSFKYEIEGVKYLRTIYTICNGEIYNYKEIRKYIEEKQTYIFKSHSDCEVILPLYKEYGIDQTIKMLNGEFAFAIFDTKENLLTNERVNNLYLGRDRFGIRPLFTTRYGNTVVFCSEVRGIIGMNEGEDNKVEVFPPRSWRHYKMENRMIREVEQEYYKIGVKPLILNTDNKYIYEMIRKTFYEAVECRLDSDRELGCLLSGGLDSSLVSAVASDILRKKGRRLRTYCVGMADSPDVMYANEVAKHINSIHTVIEIPEEEWLKQLREIIRITATFDITTIRATTGQYLAAKWISENTDIKVLLIGDGSDELTAGYMYFHKAPTPTALHMENIRLLTDIHEYDVLRADRGIASNGLEARVPFLDYNFVDLYLSIDPMIRRPQQENVEGRIIQSEKWLLRKAFEEMNILPRSVLWRKKEAFSDGVSNERKSWYKIIQEKIDEEMSDEYYEINRKKYEGYLVPHTKEALYYHEIFDEYYGGQYHITRYYWLPKWVGNVSDPSARTLEIYRQV